MRSTESEKEREALGAFFLRRLMPIAEKMRREGQCHFPLKPDPEAESYYGSREKPAMAAEDFELYGCDSVDQLQQALHEMWTQRGDTELAALASEFARLAESLQKVEEQSEEVSPFIYVMF